MLPFKFPSARSSRPSCTSPPCTRHLLQWDDKVHGMVEPFWIIVEDSDSGETPGLGT